MPFHRGIAGSKELLHKEAAFLRLGRSPGGFGDSYQTGESHIVQTLGISDPFRPKGELEAHHLVFIIACQMDDRFGETVDVSDRVVNRPTHGPPYGHRTG